MRDDHVPRVWTRAVAALAVLASRWPPAAAPRTRRAPAADPAAEPQSSSTASPGALHALGSGRARLRRGRRRRRSRACAGLAARWSRGSARRTSTTTRPCSASSASWSADAARRAGTGSSCRSSRTAAAGFVRAASLPLEAVTRTDVVDLLRSPPDVRTRTGRRPSRPRSRIGSQATPTPTGRYYVNQRLVPTDSSGPYGPAAAGISAFSNVLTGWAQGGPVAIHGTNEPWSIGQAVSNGCIRLPNKTLLKVFAEAVAGTPVIIKA